MSLMWIAVALVIGVGLVILWFVSDMLYWKGRCRYLDDENRYWREEAFEWQRMHNGLTTDLIKLSGQVCSILDARRRLS